MNCESLLIKLTLLRKVTFIFLMWKFEKWQASAFRKEWGACYNIVKPIKIILNVIVLGIAIRLIIVADTQDYGERITTPVLKYCVGFFILSALYVLFDFVQLFGIGLAASGILCILILEAVSAYFTFTIKKFTTPTFIARSTEVAFANWRLDYIYQRFQSLEGCVGLNITNDVCGHECCDDVFIQKLTSYFN